MAGRALPGSSIPHLGPQAKYDFMKNLGRALKAGAKGFAKHRLAIRQEACKFGARTVKERGQEQEALPNTTGMTLANLDWLNESGTALLCENCELIQWYAKKPERL
jgi:hypothetical protein